MLGAKEELARKARQGVPPGRDGVGVRKAGAAKMRKRYGGASAELCTCGGAGTRESYSVFFCAWLIYQARALPARLTRGVQAFVPARYPSDPLAKATTLTLD